MICLAHSNVFFSLFKRAVCDLETTGLKTRFVPLPHCHFATLRTFALEFAPVRQSSLRSKAAKPSASKHDSALT